MSSVFDDLIDQEAVIATLKVAVAASKDNSNKNQDIKNSVLCQHLHKMHFESVQIV
jgi:hypothetical protein